MLVNLLDCTLRDGGYLNNWRFGSDTIACIFDRLVRAGVDIVEVGFLDAREPFDPDRSIQPTTECYNQMFRRMDKGTSKVFVMIDFGTCPIENISVRANGFIDGIRVIFKKSNAKSAVDFGKQLVKKGYILSLQLVSITDYTDRDILEFCDLVNQVNPYAVSIVDTYGLMHKDEMLHYYHLLNRNLNSKIAIGYHSHNNFQLAYANTTEILKKNTTRNMVVDGTVYGMGKSAGNAPLELLAMYLNENYNCQYGIDQLLEIIDVNILRIYEKQAWGYSLPYFLAASNDCHPNYIHYLLDKKTLSVKAVNDIAQSIEPTRKLLYSQEYVEELYRVYQSSFATERGQSGDQLGSKLGEKNLLILGPGKTLRSQREMIYSYIETNHPVVIAANSVPEEYPLDYVFLSSSKRYSMLYRRLQKQKGKIKIIGTSNITSASGEFDILLGYEELLDQVPVISDNALAMLLNLLYLIKPASVALAGFDGFSAKTEENFYDEYMELSGGYERLLEVNDAISSKINESMDKFHIEFLTKSLYERGRNDI